MSHQDNMTIEGLRRENKMLRDCLRERDQKDIAALQAEQEAKRNEVAAKTTYEEIQLTGRDLEISRMAAWMGWHCKKQIAEGRGQEIFNFDLIRPTIAPNTWPPGDGPENYTKFVETTVAESHVRVPDISETRLGKMLAEHNATREKMDKV